MCTNAKGIPMSCPNCFARGYVARCMNCDGKGQVTIAMAGGPGEMTSTCQPCAGRGVFGVRKPSNLDPEQPAINAGGSGGGFTPADDDQEPSDEPKQSEPQDESQQAVAV